MNSQERKDKAIGVCKALGMPLTAINIKAITAGIEIGLYHNVKGVK